MADWTTFFLCQTPFNTLAPDYDDGTEAEDDYARRLYAIYLVRTKLDNTARR